ncbi:MAG: type I glyceraldehyde-3-phosphate dehydrogenase [Pseudomonadota bacterium]
MKLAINGFGRIGRNILRALVESQRTDVQIIAINDLTPVTTIAHLLAFDSIHGRFPGTITIKDNTIDCGFGPISISAERDPAKLPWGDVDIALECTGIFTTRDKASAHLETGVKAVVVSAPCEKADKTIVYGVNHAMLQASDRVISNASCTTNCLSPMAKILQDTAGIARGFMTTVHSYTGDQPTLDAVHKDLYRARAAAQNIIPTSTGAAKAVGLILPELQGKLDGVALRVPTPNVSVVDLTIDCERACDVDQVNDAFIKASNGPLKDILGTTSAPLVSMDFNHDSHSCVVALDQTKIVDDSMLRVLGWYDNEWAFSNRMLDTAYALGKAIT